MSSKCYLWSWRSHQIDFDRKAWCSTWGKNWSFQLERGEETGKLHFQGIISLKTKRTKAECLSVMNDLPEYFEPVANKNLAAGSEAFYVTKVDTRVEGPWTDKDEIQFIPYHLVGKELNLYPWQQQIWDSAGQRESRTINVIVERRGCVGKSTICGLIRTHNRGLQLPPMNDPDKLMQVALCIMKDRQIRDPKLVIIDIPRAVKQDTLAGLFAACEQIKDGWCYDWRHHWNEWSFHPPQVWVFTNTMPHAVNLSHDRWRLWAVSEREGNLTALTLEEQS